MQEEPSASAFLRTFGLLALATSLAAIFYHFSRQPGLNTCVPEFIGLSLAAGALYLVGVYLVEKFRFGAAALLIILVGAVAFRLFLLPLRPSLSGDVYRYRWEGRVQRRGINPYTVYPAVPALAGLQDPAHPLETGTAVSTVYPPLSEMAFRVVETIPAYKRLFTAIDLANVALLLLILAALKQPLHRVLVYAWNPTVVVSFALCGHHDSLAILALLAANLLIIHGRRRLAISFLALSAISKFFSVLLLPVFLRRTRYAYAGIFLAVVALGYLPYLGAGRQLFQGLSDYATGWEGNDSLFRLIRLAGNSKAQAELVAGVLVLALVAYTLKKRMTPLGSSLFLIAGLLLLSPDAFPWYFTWMIPFLCFYPSVPMLLVSVTCVLGYAPVVAYAAGLPYRDSPFILALEYVPVCLWLAYEGWRAIPRGSALGTGG
jgi:hypothetical protein